MAKNHSPTCRKKFLLEALKSAFQYVLSYQLKNDKNLAM